MGEKVRRAPSETAVNCGIKSPQDNINWYVEFGTSKMAAQPYLRPAAQKVMNEEADQLADLANSTEELVKGIALAIEREAKEKVPVDTGNLRGSITAQRVR